MRWKYDEKKDFEKKYELVLLTETKPSAEVLDALEAEPPPISELLALGNAATLRAQMERHCAIQGVPWDQIFGAAERAEAAGPGDEPWDKERQASAGSAAPAPQPAPRQQEPPRPDPVVATVAAAQQARQPSPPAQAPAAVSEAEPYECEVCNGPNSSATRCRHCGSEYDETTGALTYDATKPVGPANMPKAPDQAPQPAAQPQAPAASASPPAEAPAAGREPARRRRRAAG